MGMAHSGRACRCVGAACLKLQLLRVCLCKQSISRFNVAGAARSAIVADKRPSCNAQLTQCVFYALRRWIGLAAGSKLADLMGTKGQKKGGLKSSHMHKNGLQQQLNGLHTDGRPLTVSLQV